MYDMTMKILFLDIDGVLNSRLYDLQRTAEQGNIDETRLPLLKQIVDETQALIVLTSSWRKHWESDLNQCDTVGKELHTLFAKHQLPIHDKTPCLPDNDRAAEIRTWLAHHNACAYVILDDIALGWEELAPRVVKTNYRIGRGLETNHVQQAIAILNNKF